MTLKKYIIIIVTTFLFSNSLFAETITKQLTTLNNLYKEGAITEEEFSKAKKILLEKPISEKDEINLQEYILDKLDISKNEFHNIMKMKNKNFRNFKTYYNFFRYFKFPIKILYKLNFIPIFSNCCPRISYYF